MSRPYEYIEDPDAPPGMVYLISPEWWTCQPCQELLGRNDPPQYTGWYRCPKCGEVWK